MLKKYKKNQKKECRICYYLDKPENLISPCKCIGSIQYVHQKCIEHFIETTENDYFKTYCHVCNTKYDFISYELCFIQYVCLFFSILGFLFYFSLIIYIIAQLIVLFR